MRWLLVIVAVLVSLAALAWIAGSALPREHRAASRITLQPPEFVWLVVRDLGALKGTWSELSEAVRGADSVGREIWNEKVSGFEMRLLVSEAAPTSRLVTTIQSPPGSAFGGRWIYQLAPSGSGTTVSRDGGGVGRQSALSLDVQAWWTAP